MSRRDYIAELYGEDLVILDNPSFDSAIVGVSSDDRVIYDYDKMVDSLMHDESFKDDEGNYLSYEDAIDWIDFNTLRALPYIKNSPIVMYNIEDNFNEEKDDD
jgi:hypothetical protein